MCAEAMLSRRLLEAKTERRRRRLVLPVPATPVAPAAAPRAAELSAHPRAATPSNVAFPAAEHSVLPM